MRRIKGFVIAALVTSMLFGASLTSEAAPKTMPDGQIFDAQFYAQNYPDVVAVLGNNESMLYSHYVNMGKAEGRLPYAGAQGAVNAQGTADVTVSYHADETDLGNGNRLLGPITYTYDCPENVIVNITDADIIDAAMHMLPEGAKWGMESFYDKISNVKREGKWINQRAQGCLAFAFWLTDSIYGKVPMNCYRINSVENPAAGFEYCMYDIVIFDTPETAVTGINHAGVIVGADPVTQTLYLANGNYGGTVKWNLPLKTDGSDGNIIGMVLRREGVTP
ncbi:MAG: hypothetical protein K2K21_06525 [Lachnospiraceae bacterium]|nr:hypothetical protein [Lachnospiraceae bacterium]